MGFLSILAAWLLLRWRGPIPALQRDGWLPAWYRRADRWLAPLPAELRPLLICALPCLPVALLAYLLAPWLGGVLLFAFGLAVLLYSVGRGDMRAELDAYLERWSRGDLEAAYQAAAQVVDVDGQQPVENAADLHARVRRALLYTALERWFAVVFWFYLLGPAAALFYRSVQWFVRQRSGAAEAQQALSRCLYWLEWLPVRLLGLTFAVTGNFAGCFRAWREHFAAAGASADLLALYAERAQSGASAASDEPHFEQRAGAELRELNALLGRSAIAWLVLFALLQMVR